jgi:hypothetical protein
MVIGVARGRHRCAAIGYHATLEASNPRTNATRVKIPARRRARAHETVDCDTGTSAETSSRQCLR